VTATSSTVVTAVFLESNNLVGAYIYIYIYIYIYV
jgi:hypothetical protein